jgi:hypothetical protein
MTRRSSAKPRTYVVVTRFCEEGHDTHVTGTDYNGYCNVCQGKTSPSAEQDRQRAEDLLKLTTKLEHCMPWERRDILMEIRALKRGSTD